MERRLQWACPYEITAYSLIVYAHDMRFGFAYDHYIANYHYEGKEFPHDECFPTSIGRIYKNVFTQWVTAEPAYSTLQGNKECCLPKFNSTTAKNLL